ncbi:MAG: hypothetical protein AB2A00_05080 [Myxococcota bacterium]
MHATLASLLLTSAALAQTRPDTPFRLFGNVVRDGVVLTQVDPEFTNTTVKALWRGPNGEVEVASMTLGTRGDYYVLDVPAGDGVTGPAITDPLRITVNDDPVESGVPLSKGSVRRLDLAHRPGAYITIFPVDNQVIIAGQTLTVQLETVAWNGETLISAPSSSVGGDLAIEFSPLQMPSGASVHPFTGVVTFQATDAVVGRQVIEVLAGLPPMETTVRFVVSVIPSACAGIPGIATGCTNGLGVCTDSGFTTCDVNTLQPLCDAPIITPTSPELGGNTLDDDCNGTTDEGFDNHGLPCAPTGTSVCELSGRYEYTSDLTALECVTSTDPPVTVSCDDGDPCSADSCDPSAGCQYTTSPIGTTCNGGAGVCSVGSCVDVVPGMVCNTPEDVTVASTTSGDLASAIDSTETLASCTGSSDWAGPDLFYRISLAPGMEYRVTVTPTGSANVQIVLHDDGCAGACMMAVDAQLAGQPETLLIASDTSARTLILQVTSPENARGAFELLLEEVPPPPDAGSPVDAGIPVDGAVALDAGQAVSDAAIVVDASPGIDATVPPEPDAGTPGSDAGVEIFDAGVVVGDAGVTTDAAIPGTDAATPEADAGQPGTDASVPDAATPPDGAVTPDANVPDAAVREDAGVRPDAGRRDAGRADAGGVSTEDGGTSTPPGPDPEDPAQPVCACETARSDVGESALYLAFAVVLGLRRVRRRG